MGPQPSPARKTNRLFPLSYFLLFLISLPLSLKAWTTVGMGGGGAEYAPSISPLNSNLRFVGCDMSGWYRSTDGGNTWNMLDFFQISTSVDYGFNNGVMCPMAFHPTNANTVYGFGAQQDTQFNSPNLLVSNDGGMTWSVVAGANPAPWPSWGSAGGRVAQIYIDRGDSNFILIGTDNGVWRSINGGTSFTATTGTSGYVSGFMVDQSSAVGNRTCYVGTSAGVFKSVNEGSTWAAANTGLSTPANVLAFAGASTGTAGGTKMFVIDGNSNEIYTSTNAAAWALSSNADTFSMMACADNDITTAYATNNSNRNVWQTVNGGGAWAKVFNDTSPVANLFDGWVDFDLSFSGWGSPVDGLGVNPSNSGQVMFSDLGETFKSDTAGVSWTEAYSNFSGSPPPAQGSAWSSRGLEVTSVFQYAFDPNTSNYNYICASDIGFCYSADSGATWHNTARRNDGSFPSNWTETFYHVAFNTTAGTIFAAVSSLHDLDHSNPLGKAGAGGVIKSTNNGATWTKSATGLPSSPSTSIVYDPVNNIFYTAMWGNGVYKSDTTGNNWTICATQPVIGTNKNVYSLKLIGSNLYCLLSAKSGFANPGGLFVSANGGGTWTNLATNVTGGVPLYYPTDFDVNPSNPATIFVAAQDVWGTALANQMQGGCYRTVNGGTSWTLMTMPPGHTPYGYAPSIDPTNPNTVYYGTENQGFFQSTDDGNTWARVTTLPFSSIQHVNFGNNAMYVGTFGGGVWTQPNGATPTVTSTATPLGSTSTPTKTPTATSTFTSTATSTATSTYTATASPTTSKTFTPTNSPTASSTATPTCTATLTPTATTLASTSTPTPSPTTSKTFTTTNSPTPTSTNTLTNSPTPTPTFSPTRTPTSTPTASPTATPPTTSTYTQTPITPIPTTTFTLTFTATLSPTLTNTPSFTSTSTLTYTPTQTYTPSWTSTPTLTDTATSTFTPTDTPTVTNTPTVTLSPTPTSSYTPIPTSSWTSTPTFTFSQTLTPTLTTTLSPTPTSILLSVTIFPPYPNPLLGAGPLHLDAQGPPGSNLVWDIFSSAFRKVAGGTLSFSGTTTVNWNLTGKGGNLVSNGLYYLRVKGASPTNSNSRIFKVIILR